VRVLRKPSLPMVILPSPPSPFSSPLFPACSPGCRAEILSCTKYVSTRECQKRSRFLQTPESGHCNPVIRPNGPAVNRPGDRVSWENAFKCRGGPAPVCRPGRRRTAAAAAGRADTLVPEQRIGRYAKSGRHPLARLVVVAQHVLRSLPTCDFLTRKTARTHYTAEDRGGGPWTARDLLERKPFLPSKQRRMWMQTAGSRSCFDTRVVRWEGGGRRGPVAPAQTLAVPALSLCANGGARSASGPGGAHSWRCCAGSPSLSRAPSRSLAQSLSARRLSSVTSAS